MAILTHILSVSLSVNIKQTCHLIACLTRINKYEQTSGYTLTDSFSSSIYSVIHLNFSTISECLNNFHGSGNNYNKAL